MTKKNITITIEEKLLKKAKEQIPNISAFVESCMNNYLEGTFPVSDANTIIRQIGKLQVDLYLINEDNNVEEAIKQKDNEYTAKLVESNFEPEIIIKTNEDLINEE